MYSWDFCPGDLLIREAKGNSTDISGNRLKFKERNCIITAPGYLFSNTRITKNHFSFVQKVIFLSFFNFIHIEFHEKYNLIT